MAGFRLTDGTSGCPPTETPPAGYKNPFRFDDAGRLWISACFKGFRYLGSARHDIGVTTLIDSPTVPQAVGSFPLYNVNGITAGVYNNVTIVNDTKCTMGVLLGCDMIVDSKTYQQNLVSWIVSHRWNGASHSRSVASTPLLLGGTGYFRTSTIGGTGPHDANAEPGGGSSMTIAAGASATFGARFFVEYIQGAPTGSEYLYSASTAVRAYGFILD